MTVELLAPAAIRRRPAFSFARWLERSKESIRLSSPAVSEKTCLKSGRAFVEG